METIKPLTWEEAKDQVAKKMLFDDWSDFFGTFLKDQSEISRATKEAAELYASSRVREVEETNAKLTGIVTHFEHEMELTKSLLEASEQENKRLQELIDTLKNSDF